MNNVNGNIKTLQEREGFIHPRRSNYPALQYRADIERKSGGGGVNPSCNTGWIPWIPGERGKTAYVQLQSGYCQFPQRTDTVPDTFAGTTRPVLRSSSRASQPAHLIGHDVPYSVTRHDEELIRSRSQIALRVRRRGYLTVLSRERFIFVLKVTEGTRLSITAPRRRAPGMSVSIGTR